jgi:hypothetical protein
MKKLLFALLVFALTVTGLFCNGVQAVQNETMDSIATATDSLVLVMVTEGSKFPISAAQYDEGDEDEGDDEGDEDEEEGGEY